MQKKYDYLNLRNKIKMIGIKKKHAFNMCNSLENNVTMQNNFNAPKIGFIYNLLLLIDYFI